MANRSAVSAASQRLGGVVIRRSTPLYGIFMQENGIIAMCGHINHEIMVWVILDGFAMPGPEIIMARMTEKNSRTLMLKSSLILAATLGTSEVPLKLCR